MNTVKSYFSDACDTVFIDYKGEKYEKTDFCIMCDFNIFIGCLVGYIYATAKFWVSGINARFGYCDL